MYWRIILNVVLVVGLALGQIAFVSALPGWFNNINLVVIVLVFILSLRIFRLAFWWALGVGGILEIYSFLPFGSHIMGLVAACLLINFLLINVLTNRSLYSYLALTAAAVIIYESVLYLYGWIVFYFSKKDFVFNLDKAFWLDKLHSLLMDAIVVCLIFYTINFIGKNFKPVFLVRNKV